MTNNGIVNIHGKQYVTVAKRLQDAHKGEKLQGVKTEILQFDPVIVIKATVSISGIEYSGISSINTEKVTGNTEKSSPYEVAETSAVGRALAFAGYETEQGIASAEEVEKAIDTEDIPTEGSKLPVTDVKEDCPICHSEVFINEGVAGPNAQNPGKPWKNKKCKKDKDHIVWWDFDLDGWRGL